MTILVERGSAERVGQGHARLTVPWGTVIPLAVLMAYADGFFITSVRGAVGAIERTQQPFTTFWRESTVLLPVFIFAVLGALTLGLRRFGPKPATKKMLVTALLVAAAGTLVTVVVMVLSSVYDYGLQSAQLALMGSSHGSCTASCLALQQHSTFAAHVRAIAFVTGMVLATNLVLVGWLVAMRGGRLKVASVANVEAPAAGALPTQPKNEDGAQLWKYSRAGNIRLLLVAGLLGSAAINGATVPGHLGVWPLGALLVVLLTAAEFAVARWLLARREGTVLLAAAAVSALPVLGWAYSHTLGFPFGPGAGVRETVGVADTATLVLGVGTAIAAVILLRGTTWLQRPPASAHVRGLVIVAVVAVTVIGLAGTASVWFDSFGGAANPAGIIGSR